MIQFDFAKCNYFIFFADKKAEVFNIPLQEIEKNVNEGLAEDPYNAKLMQIQMQIQFSYYNNINETLNICKQILQIDPQNIDARLEIVYLLLHLGQQLECCQPLIDECLEIDNTYWRIYYAQCIKYMYEKNNAKTLYLLTHYQKKYPDNPWLSILLAQILIGFHSKQDLVKQLFEQTMKFGTFDYDLLLRICYVNEKINDDKNQVDIILKQVLILNPKSAKAHNNYGFFQRSLNNNHDECIKSCLTAIAICPLKDDPYFNLGISYSSQGQFQKSITNFKKCIQMNKFYHLAYSQIIYLSNQINIIEQSIYYAQKYIQLFPLQQYGKYFYSYIFRYRSKYIKNDKEFLEISQQNLINLIVASGKLEESINYFQETYTLNHFLRNEI